MKRLLKSRRSARAKFSLFLIFSAVAIAFILIAIAILVLRPTHLRFALTKSNEENAQLIKSIELIFSRERLGVQLTPVFIEDNVDVSSFLASAKADLGIVRASADLSSEVQTIAILRKNIAIGWVWVANTGKKVENFEDLVGLKIAFVSSNPDDLISLKNLFDLAAIDAKKINFVTASFDQLADVLLDTTIRGVVSWAPGNSKLLAKAVNETKRAKGEVKILGLSNSEAIAQKSPPYESFETPAGLYSLKPRLPEEDISTLALNDLIVARRSLSEDHVAAVTRQLFNVRQSFLKDDRHLANLEPPDTGKGAPISVHQGSAAFIDGTERTFLERYSDFMWAGLLLISGFGTAGAWLRSRLLQSEREHNLTLRERLVTLLDQIPEAGSLEQLDEMRKAADKTFRDTMACFEDGAIDEGSLTSFSVVLAQFNHAINNRANELLTASKAKRKTLPQRKARH